MIVRLNIGLERANDIGIDHHGVYGMLINAACVKRQCATSRGYRKVESAGGDWNPEPVLWVELEVVTTDDVDLFKKALEALCIALGEDSIAVAIVSPSIADGTLIWHPHYTGEKYEFNIDYFTE